MGSSSQQQAGTTNQEPWTVQQPYLKTAFNDANAALNTANGSTTPAPGQFTASYTPAMMDAFQKELGFGTGNVNAVSGNQFAAGDKMLGSGMNATSAGLFGLAGFNPQGGTQNNINAATAYANNPAVDGMVTAAMRDANRTYTEQTQPGIERNAAFGGNQNSSTKAIAQGIALRGLDDKAADTSANIRGGLFSKGLDTALSDNANQNSSSLAALLGLTQGGTSATNSGTLANQGGVSNATGLFNIANSGAANLNSGNQADLTNALQAWQFAQNSPFTALNNYYNIVGNKSWGGTGQTNQTTTSTPSTLSQIAGGVGIFGSLFG